MLFGYAFKNREVERLIDEEEEWEEEDWEDEEWEDEE